MDAQVCLHRLFFTMLSDVNITGEVDTIMDALLPSKFSTYGFDRITLLKALKGTMVCVSRQNVCNKTYATILLP
jgi:hypothetical protein